MMLAAYKIVLDPETFDLLLIMVTDKPAEALDAMMRCNATFHVAATRPDVPFYGLSLTGLYLIVSRGAANIVKAFPPKRLTEMTMKDWGYGSTLKTLP